MTRYFQDDYTPWSLVLPIALAVMLGVLPADLFRLRLPGMMAVSLRASNGLKQDLSRGSPPVPCDYPLGTMCPCGTLARFQLGKGQ